MTQSLGETLKELLWIKQFSFEEIPQALNQGFGYDFALGKNYALWRELFSMRLIKDGIYQILKALRFPRIS